MNAAARYAAICDTAWQSERLSDINDPGDPWGDWAESFRLDPLRSPGDNLATLAGYLRETDRLVDVGGGAGRVSLALASRVAEVELVEPSDGMRAQFLAARDAAAITNAVVSDDWWMDAPATGDVVTVSDVTYFVSDIVPFVAKLHNSAARRVMITVWRPTPDNMYAALRATVLGGHYPSLPGLPELAAVLWEMGLLPEIRPLPELPWWYPEAAGGLSREAAIEFAVAQLENSDENVRNLVEANFERIFQRDDEVFTPRWLSSAREILITWETHGWQLP